MPAWAISAMLVSCSVQSGACTYQHLPTAISKKWCGKTERGWIEGVGEVRITVRCAK